MSNTAVEVAVQPASRRRAPAFAFALAAVAIAGLVWWFGPWNAELRYSRMGMVALKRLAEDAGTDRLAWRQLGLRLARSGDGDMAEPALRHAFELDPSDPEVATGLGEILTARKEYPEAEQVLKAAVNHHPEFSLARMALGRLYRRQGSYGHALDQFRAVTERDPGFSDAFYEQAVCYLQLQQVARAQAAVSQALAKVPDDPNYLSIQASIHAALGNIPGATQALQLASTRAPGDVQIQANLAKMLLTTGRGGSDTELAQQAVERLEALSSTHPLLPFLHGQVAVQRQQWHAADEHLREAVRTTPDLNEAYYALAQVQLRLDRREEAERLLATYRHRQDLLRRIDELRINLGNRPGQAELYLELAELQLELGDRRGAQASARNAVDLAPDDREVGRRAKQLEKRIGPKGVSP
ncbi:MAG: tetratricopeptide repeat protein [Armatimonadota bacterium]